MSDREFLELAAKAAGYEAYFWSDNCALMCQKGSPLWNPLEDDGDALRLAVKLGLSVTIFDDAVGIGCRELPDGQKYEETPLGDDPYAATRRAITRAAAEIGRAME